MKQKRNSRRAGKGDIQITIYPKTGRSVGRNTGRKKKQMYRRQIGDFLNRYDFTYAGRDVVNQVGNCTKHHKSGNW